MPQSLGTPLPMQQEVYSKAFLIAVAGIAGCAAAEPTPDEDSIDWTLSCRLKPRRPKLDVQLKSTSRTQGTADELRYALKKKNYDDLIITNVSVPRILVLVAVPEKIEDWMTLSHEQLVLRQAAYWVSLAGRPESDNETTVTISIPRDNLFTASALCEMMKKTNEGVAL